VKVRPSTFHSLNYKTMRTSRYFGLPYGLMMIAIIGCNTDPIIDPPLQPPPVLDCSQNVTVPAADTLVHPPPYQGVTQPDYIYYEGYELTDISFNPNDPNQLVVAVYINRQGVIPQITSNGFAIVRVDICTGAESVIYVSEHDGTIKCLDWGKNDSIAFVQGRDLHSVFTLRPDGSNLFGTEIPFGYFDSHNVRWSLDGESIYLAHLAANIVQFNIAGTLLSSDIDLPAPDFDYLPDGRIGYIGSGIHIFDPTTGNSEMLDALPYISNRYDVAYSEKHNALFWAADTVVGLTNIETGQTTLLKVGGNDVVRYYNTAASTNGYLAYKAYVISPTLSTNNSRAVRTELRFINADGTNERRLVLDFQ